MIDIKNNNCHLMLDREHEAQKQGRPGLMLVLEVYRGKLTLKSRLLIDRYPALLMKGLAHYVPKPGELVSLRSTSYTRTLFRFRGSTISGEIVDGPNQRLVLEFTDTAKVKVGDLASPTIGSNAFQLAVTPDDLQQIYAMILDTLTI